MNPNVPQPVLQRLSEANKELLFVTVSGAHLYGFESPDSDWDLRGCFLANLAEVVSLRPPSETYEVLDKDTDPEIDIVLHEAKKFFAMLLKNNGYVLEQVFSPLVVASHPVFDELKAIAARGICRQNRYHFFHFGQDQWKTATGSSRPTVKGLLYTYRPLLAGIHLMRTGRVESNLRVLNEEFRIAEIDELIQRKLGGEERMRVSPDELESHRPRVDALCAQLYDATNWSELPERSEIADDLDDLLVRLRLGR